MGVDHDLISNNKNVVDFENIHKVYIQAKIV